MSAYGAVAKAVAAAYDSKLKGVSSGAEYSLFNIFCKLFEMKMSRDRFTEGVGYAYGRTVQIIVIKSRSK